jgi:hypothetical protein
MFTRVSIRKVLYPSSTGSLPVRPPDSQLSYRSLVDVSSGMMFAFCR